MQLTHKIALDPTYAQAGYFRRAAGTARFVYNWGLAEWQKQFAAGEKPNNFKLKKQFNAIYKAEFPWVADVHRDCHSQPFNDLQKAYNSFFRGTTSKPVFKKKSSTRPAFYVANDKLTFNGKTVKLPVIGNVRMREPLRLAGRLLSARVVEECGRWFICATMDVVHVSNNSSTRVVGVDLGVKTLVTLSDGELVENLKPLQRTQQKLRRASRKLARRTKGSKNRNKQRLVVARIHRRVSNIRHDQLHKLTTRLAKNHGEVVIEDLAVKNMLKNHCLAQSISDAGWAKFRTLLTYKCQMHGTRLTVVDRFYPSSKTCSSCGRVKQTLTLDARIFSCVCGLVIDRDLNAALNLRKLGTACAEVTTMDSHGTG